MGAAVPDEYQRENRSRIIDLEKAVQEAKLATVAQTLAIEGLKSTMESHAEYARAQHEATNANVQALRVATDTGMQDLKGLIEKERDEQRQRREAEDARRAEQERLAAKLEAKRAALEVAKAEATAEELKAGTLAAQATAHKWATIRSAFTPQTILLILSIITGLLGKSFIDAVQQQQLAAQVIEQYEAGKALKALPKPDADPEPPS